MGDDTVRWCCGEGLRVDIPSTLMAAVVLLSGAGSGVSNGIFPNDARAEAASEGGAVTVRILFCESCFVIDRYETVMLVPLVVPRCLRDLGLGVRLSVSGFIFNAREVWGEEESAKDSGEDSEDEGE